MPLQTIINPVLVNDLLKSLTTMAEESGREYYERWELLNAYSGCMLGNPAISVLADAMRKVFVAWDMERLIGMRINLESSGMRSWAIPRIAEYLQNLGVCVYGMVYVSVGEIIRKTGGCGLLCEVGSVLPEFI